MIYHLVSLFGSFKTFVEIKAFQKNFYLYKKMGKKVFIPARQDKILITIAHVVPNASDGDPGKIQRLKACIDALTRSLASYSYKIVLLSKLDCSLHWYLPEYMIKNLEVYYSDQPDPMHVEFDALEVFKRDADRFDYFMFMEDDIVITDSWLINKIKSFNSVCPHPNYVLLPHRFEYDKGIKYYLDQVAVINQPSETYRYAERLKVNLGDVDVCFYENPHAAFYCINKQQLQLWMDSGYRWKNRVVAFGPLESAATFTLFENFKFMKPHPDCIDYFEVQHLGNKYILSNKITSRQALSHT